MFQYMGPVFLYFFQNFPNLSFRDWVQGLALRLWLGLPFAFTMLLPGLIHCNILIMHYCHVARGG